MVTSRARSDGEWSNHDSAEAKDENCAHWDRYIRSAFRFMPAAPSNAMTGENRSAFAVIQAKFGLAKPYCAFNLHGAAAMGPQRRSSLSVLRSPLRLESSLKPAVTIETCGRQAAHPISASGPAAVSARHALRPERDFLGRFIYGRNNHGRERHWITLCPTRSVSR